MKKLHVNIYSVTEDDKIIYGQTRAGAFPAKGEVAGIQLDGDTDGEIIRKVFLNTLAVVAKTMYPDNFESKLIEFHQKFMPKIINDRI